jgi:hypothetical protein
MVSGRMPTAGRQSAEYRLACSILIEMEGLWIEFGAKRLDSLLVDPKTTGAKSLPHRNRRHRGVQDGRVERLHEERHGHQPGQEGLHGGASATSHSAFADG